MADHDDDKEALGARLRAARKLAGFTLDTAKDALTAAGYKIGKAGLGHWETGTNVPDAFAIRHMAKLYGVSADALLREPTLPRELVGLSSEAAEIALTIEGWPPQRRARALKMWRSLIAVIEGDAEGTGSD